MEMTENNNNGENMNNGCNSSQFPDGMRVLAVDDNLVCLTLLTTLLNKCRYQVTSLRNKTEAIELLKQNVDNYDIVLTNVYNNEMEGFKLLEAGLELDIPVIMISASESKDIIMKGVKYGAVDYLIKPVRLEAIQTIWQHVYRKRLTCSSSLNYYNKVASPINNCIEENRGDHRTGGNLRKEDENLVNDGIDKEIQGNVETSKSSKKGGKRKSPLGDDENVGSDGDYNNPAEKRGRIKWTKERQDKFLNVVDRLGGIEKAVPKKILELMGEPDLTREQVASHLQKFRNSFKKKPNCDQSANHNNINNNNNNCYPHLLASPSMGSLGTTTPSHQPNLVNTMSRAGLLGPNYQLQPNNNRGWMAPSIGYRPPLFQQPRMMPNIGSYMGSSPNTMFQQPCQQLPQDGSFGSRLQPPEEVFDRGPSMIDSTHDLLPLSNIFDDVALGYPTSFDFSEDANKDQIYRAC